MNCRKHELDQTEDKQMDEKSPHFYGMLFKYKRDPSNKYMHMGSYKPRAREARYNPKRKSSQIKKKQVSSSHV